MNRHDKINKETAKISWISFQPLFASGKIIYVDKSLDLIKVAMVFIDNDHYQVQSWIDSGFINKVLDEQAISWHKNKVYLWANVVKPWLLVQET